jgi:hypothetical protein
VGWEEEEEKTTVVVERGGSCGYGLRVCLFQLIDYII